MLNIRQIVGAVLLFVTGLFKLIGGCKDFYELEKGIHELCQKVCNQIFTWALEQLDTRLMNERDRSTWRVVGFREKTAISTFGEFPYKRRLYKNKKTGETSFFLDELLGWPERATITPRLKELAVKLSTELPFDRVAEILSYLAPGVSSMTIWQATQEVGEVLQREGQEKRAAVFEDGEAPGGKEVAPELCIEADGVIIRLQRAKQKRGEIKHIVAYEGKEQIDGDRFALKNKLVLSSLNEGEAAWEEGYAEIGGKWDLSRVQKIYIGGDGADWPKQGVEYFPGAEYRLDPYHLSKHLTEALWYDEETFRKVAAAISRGNWQETQGVLTEAAKKTRGNRKKRITKLLHYLEENWVGIVASAGAKRLGTIEGQIQHNVARRMKRLGARWTINGGDRMARILAAKANGKLDNYVLRWPVKHEKLRELAQKPVEKQKAGDVEKWLQATLPALKGPFADRPWIKYVLRELARPDFAALIG
ncbi:ISLre2 family transposase [Desulfofundulus sp. TPOSR]|uniref:ISLre2 family transposase n=1 Tax=Desulfofundulus sp. TPOSR TaxID=2714340 RepID=UPI00140CCADA|nr:ISLre2 family transposase [Desulfofundulus sp. TPOSR]NHM26889.1 ISLre2 family transposase [Desulfofundulus sp. TPOSR]